MNQDLKALGFDKILARLQENALSPQAKATLAGLEPSCSEDVCRRRTADTSAARAVLDGCGAPPLAAMQNLTELLALAEAGAMLTTVQLAQAARFAVDCRRMRAYLKRGEAYGPDAAVYGRGMEDLSGLQEEIEAACSEDRVYDEASAALRAIRRKMEHLEAQIKEKLSHILQSRRQYLADSYIATRSGHYVLPVQRKYQSQFGGTVIEVSGKGGTVFMEPSSVAAAQSELTALSVQEDSEVRRILYTLSAEVAACAGAIRRNMDTMEALDVLFAKAKLSADMNARAVPVTGSRTLRLLQARHPLLQHCVPLDLVLDGDTDGVVITGPNTGGKTVALKTVGLLSAMAQCGLHLPCAEGSSLALQDGFWCDIGDSQSLSQNLSTFSGHITNVIRILQSASRDSLVLLDELGSGTDPAEGMGIAVAVLEELRQRGCTFLVTTHYPQVKEYAAAAQRVQSARMAFDAATLQPLYRLEMGKSGESCALAIAARLGLAPHLLARARREVYGAQGEAAPPAQQMHAPKSHAVRTVLADKAAAIAAKFAMGDSVLVLPGKEIGIVYRPADKNGDVIVQVKGQKRRVKHNRLQLQVAAAELYPPDYDFSIVFDSVANRKARHTMQKRHDPTVSATCDEEIEP